MSAQGFWRRLRVAGLCIAVCVALLPVSLRGQGKVLISHRTGSGRDVPVFVAASAVRAHLRHGDSLGCPSRIAFDSERDGTREIYSMNPDGTNQTRLTNNQFVKQQATWSPDGNKLAFTSNRNGNWDIYVMDADGSNEVQLTANPFDDTYSAWSPDGALIAFTSNRDGNNEIYVMDALTGADQANLTNNPAEDEAPTWSPDGSQIAFHSNRDGANGIFVMSDTGSNLRAITPGLFAENPNWSPDGSRIVFSGGGGGTIYVMDASGLHQPQALPVSGLRASWSPDAAMIAFWSQGDGEINVVDANGFGATALTMNPAQDRYPNWSRCMFP